MSFAPPWSLSPSSCSSFKECPLAFRFSYLERLPEPPAPWTSKGTLVHRALELLLDRPADERTHRRRARRPRRGPGRARGRPRLRRPRAHRGRVGAVRRRRRVARAQATSSSRTRAPSARSASSSSSRPTSGRVRLRGIIDRLELDDDGELVVTDYKTGSVPSERWEAKSLGGVHMYALLCERMLGRRPARVQLLYLSKPEAIIATPTEQSVTRRRAPDRRALRRHRQRRAAATTSGPQPGASATSARSSRTAPRTAATRSRRVELRGPGTVIEPSLPLPLVPAG